MNSSEKQRQKSAVFARANDSGGWMDYKIEAVISGEPRARIKVLRISGTRTPLQHVSLISAEPSKFQYKFHYDEAFQLCTGHLSVTLDTGEMFEMFPGDVLTVPGGHDSVFEIFEPSMKFVVVTACAKA